MIPLLDVTGAARALLAGELVVVPTESVYGLAADALNPEAVARIFAAKGRPAINPIICHLPNSESVFQYGERSATAEALAHLWPGPLTVLLPHHGRIPSIVTAGSPLAGFRVPDHPVMSQLLQLCQRPLAAPSANRSGERSPTSLAMIRDPDLPEYAVPVAGALDGGPCRVGVESTVVAIVDDSSRSVRILRPGGISREQLEAAGLRVLAEPEPGAETGKAAPLHAPGQLLKHYGPGVPLVLLANADAAERHAQVLQAANAALNPEARPVWWLGFGAEPAPALCTETLDLSPSGDDAEAAHNLFQYFERMRQARAGLIVCARLPESGLGAAINDRLTRAATRRIPD